MECPPFANFLQILFKIHRLVPEVLHFGRLVMPWQIFHLW